MKAPFLPNINSDNFDHKYCNAVDNITEKTKIRYELYLKDEKLKSIFNEFDFIRDDIINSNTVININNQNKNQENSKISHCTIKEFNNPHNILSNTGKENILIEKKSFAELNKQYNLANKKCHNNTQTISLIKQCQNKLGNKFNIFYNKKKNNSINYNSNNSVYYIQNIYSVSNNQSTDINNK